MPNEALEGTRQKARRPSAWFLMPGSRFNATFSDCAEQGIT